MFSKIYFTQIRGQYHCNWNKGNFLTCCTLFLKKFWFTRMMIQVKATMKAKLKQAKIPTRQWNPMLPLPLLLLCLSSDPSTWMFCFSVDGRSLELPVFLAFTFPESLGFPESPGVSGVFWDFQRFLEWVLLHFPESSKFPELVLLWFPGYPGNLRNFLDPLRKWVMLRKHS